MFLFLTACRRRAFQVRNGIGWSSQREIERTYIWRNTFVQRAHGSRTTDGCLILPSSLLCCCPVCCPRYFNTTAKWQCRISPIEGCCCCWKPNHEIKRQCEGLFFTIIIIYFDSSFFLLRRWSCACLFSSPFLPFYTDNHVQLLHSDCQAPIPFLVYF